LSGDNQQATTERVRSLNDYTQSNDENVDGIVCSAWRHAEIGRNDQSFAIMAKVTKKGYGTPEEYAERAKEINQQYLCITDHGMMGAVPRQIRACEQYKLSFISGIELYVQDKHVSEDDRKQLSDEDKKAIRKSYHLLAIAYNNQGYSNLVRLSSWGWLHGFYYKPRVTHEQLLKYKEGIIFTSCCYNGEIGQAFDKGGAEQADVMLEKYIKMFSPNFYLEIMLLDFVKQKPYDKYIVSRSEKYKLPIIVTNDNHYVYKDDSKDQRIMLMIQNRTTLAEIEKRLSYEDKQEIFELQDSNLWMKSEEELNEKWLEMYQDAIPLEVFEQAKKNTVEICRKAKGVILDRNVKLPQIPNADDKFKEELIKGFKWRGLTGKEYVNRLKEEKELICRKGFASYFLIQKMFVDEARRICPLLLGYGNGSEAIGCGRGSSVSSLCCYCLGITDVDPIRHGLLFSRFLSEARGGKSMKLRFTGEPDVD
jgi:DNA polymerase III subunit alpha